MNKFRYRLMRGRCVCKYMSSNVFFNIFFFKKGVLFKKKKKVSFCLNSFFERTSILATTDGNATICLHYCMTNLLCPSKINNWMELNWIITFLWTEFLVILECFPVWAGDWWQWRWARVQLPLFDSNHQTAVRAHFSGLTECLADLTASWIS